MTSLIAWAGMDNHGQTSLYFATDSRISWGDKPPFWDRGVKVFGCFTQPDIFAFTGDGLFAVSVITKLSRVIDSGLAPTHLRDSLTTRCQWVTEFIEMTLPGNRQLLDSFTIFYGTRLGHGTAPNSQMRQKYKGSDFDPHRGSWFGGCMASWDKQSFKTEQLDVPLDRSQYIAADGTGGKSVVNHQAMAERAPQERTSRIIFRAFCNSLNSNNDPRSGGMPQIVGLYRNGPAKVIGVITAQGPSFLGSISEFTGDAGMEWRNEDLQRVTVDGNLVRGAKRHAF